jgi:hypothetical protein
MLPHANWRLILTSSLLSIGVSAFAAEPPTDETDVSGSALAAPTPKDAPKTAPAAKPRVLVTISKATTYITEPLHPDGYPDYLGAINRRLSRGVTPENNAVVLLWKALGPKGITEKHRQRYFQMLGVAPLPEKGDYFVTSSSRVNRYESEHPPAATPPMPPTGTPQEREDPAKTPWGQMDVALKRPWSKREFPFWAEWLQINEKPLALVVEACRRPRRYEPLISGKDGTEPAICAQLPVTEYSRDCVRALKMRAMLRIHEGKIDEAWSDLLDCHRLARLTNQSATLVDALVAFLMDGMAQQGDLALLQHSKLTSAQIAKMQADLDALPAITPTMADRLDFGERCSFLDCVVLMARNGPSVVNNLLDVPQRSDSSLQVSLDALSKSAIDWDVALRMGNSWFDRMAADARKPTRSERLKAWQQRDKELRRMAAAARDPKSLGLQILADPRKALSDRAGQLLVSLLLPASGAAQEAEERITMLQSLTRLAFALAAYRADHGSYPAKLTDVTPKYMKKVPQDLFNDDKDLQYTRTADGYLLYSFGANGKDDRGHGYDDRKNNEDWDDLTVRMSPPAKP